MVIGALSAVFVMLLADKVFQRPVGLLAGLLYAIYPNHVFFSHYLWAEVFFGLLVLIAAWLFFSFAEKKNRSKTLILSFLVAGVALLAKELAVILFAGFVTTWFVLGVPGKFWKMILLSLVFLLPFVVFVSAAYPHADSRTVPYFSVIKNFRWALGKKRWPKNQIRATRGYWRALQERSVGDYLKNFKKEVYALWSPTSFPAFRINEKRKKNRRSDWGYGWRNQQILLWGTVGFHLLILFSGICGLCLSDNGPFKVFSSSCLIYLCLTALLASLISRFRLPFMFIFVIYSAFSITYPRTLLENTRHWKRTAVLLICLLIFSDIIVSGFDRIGRRR